MWLAKASALPAYDALHCSKSWTRFHFLAIRPYVFLGFVFSIRAKVSLKRPDLEVTHRSQIPIPIINIPQTSHTDTERHTELPCGTVEIIGSGPEKWRSFHHQKCIGGWLWSAGCLLWSEMILLVCWQTPCPSLCRVVGPPLPGWKSLTSDLWAVTLMWNTERWTESEGEEEILFSAIRSITGNLQLNITLIAEDGLGYLSHAQIGSMGLTCTVPTALEGTLERLIQCLLCSRCSYLWHDIISRCALTARNQSLNHT